MPGGVLYVGAFVLAPVALFALLCALPPRAARAALWAVGVPLAAVAGAWALTLPPFTGEPFPDLFLLVFWATWALAEALGLLVVALRARVAPAGRAAYPVAAPALAAAVGAAALDLLVSV